MLPSSPLEVLPPDVDDLTRTQMTRRMLKRSRRVALGHPSEGVREHLAKRIRRTKDRVSNLGEPLDNPDDLTFQTPFPSSQLAPEETVERLIVPEQMSPVPIATLISSRNLKENGSLVLASPFNSRPGSAAPSPKHKGKERSSRPLHAKSRTLSGVFKENARQVSRKGSTMSLKDANGEPSARRTKHQRYPSSPSASYMRSRITQEDWIRPPKVVARMGHNNNQVPSPAHSNTSFFADKPQSCSTPATSRLPRLPGLPGHRARTDPDVEMINCVSPTRRIHLSGNSIFSSSDEFTIRSIPGAAVEGNSVTGQVSARHDRSQEGRSLAGSFIAEFKVPLSDPDHSTASTTATKVLGPQRVPKASFGELPFGLPGTSPARGENLVIFTSRHSGAALPASPPYASPTCPPSSPASNLAQEIQSMDIHGPGAHSDGEARPRSHSVHHAAAAVVAKKSVKRKPTRNRAGTIRASDFPIPGAPSSNVRRTRSGTVVGPDSMLATKTAMPPGQTAKGGPATKLAAVPSGSESESDDELLLKGPWTEGLVYPGIPVPPGRQEAEADELNLGGLWHGLEYAPRRSGLRRR